MPYKKEFKKKKQESQIYFRKAFWETNTNLAYHVEVEDLVKL